MHKPAQLHTARARAGASSGSPDRGGDGGQRAEEFRRAPAGLFARRGRNGAAVSLQDRLADDMRFLKTWAEHPLSTAAVTPSGGMLSRLMASFVEADRPGPVVELGPGTGVVTRAMIERGIPEDRLLLVEWNTDFCALLRERFPRATVLKGDAFALGTMLSHLEDGSVASIVSGLPLFVKPVPVREQLLEDALRLMAKGAPFIQFSYALVAAVPNKPRRFAIDRSSWVLANLPPARVWTYRAIA